MPPGYRSSMPGPGWLVWFSKSRPSCRAPIGIQVDSPLQRQWITLVRSGSILRTTATVLGASRSSRRASNARFPTRILSMPNANRPTISTHVLYVTRGEPAAGVSVSVWRLEGGQRAMPQGAGETDADGRVGDLVNGPLAAGVYRLTFDVAGYFKKQGDPAPFLSRVTLDFEVADVTRRYHVPLLVSPFSCASYRGS